MGEICTTGPWGEYCAGYEVMLTAVIIECGFYILAFMFGIRVLDWMRRVKRPKREIEWHPPQVKQK